MTTTDLQKKNSIPKIIGMRIKEYKEDIVITLIIISSLAVIGLPFVIPVIPDLTGVILFLTFGLIKFGVIPVIKKLKSMINSLKGMQFIPLTEDEAEKENLDTLEKYADFINNLITHNEISLRVPDKIATQVIEFSKSYYHTNMPEISVVEKPNHNCYKVCEKVLQYEPYMDFYNFETCFEHRKKKRKFVVFSKERVLNTKEMREYLNMFPHIAEKLDLDLDADTSKRKSKYPAIQIKKMSTVNKIRE